MTRKFRYILQTTLIIMLSALISNTVLAEIVFEDQIALEEKETEEEEDNYLESSSQNVENISIGAGGKVKISTQTYSLSSSKQIYTILLTNSLLNNTSNLISKHTIAFYIRYCSLIVYS